MNKVKQNGHENYGIFMVNFVVVSSGFIEKPKKILLLKIFEMKLTTFGSLALKTNYIKVLLFTIL